MASPARRKVSNITRTARAASEVRRDPCWPRWLAMSKAKDRGNGSLDLSGSAFYQPERAALESTMRRSLSRTTRKKAIAAKR